MNFHKLNVIVANSPTGSSSDSSSGSNRSDSSSEDDDDGDRVSNKSQSEDVETISSEGKDKNDDTPTQELVLNVETDVKSSILPDKLSTKLYHNKAGEFFTGFDPTSVEFKTKTEERIRRFGQIISPDYLLTEQSLKELYSSLGVPGPKETSSESTQALHATTDITNDNISENIDGNDNNNIRYNTIYLRGTNEMSTKDVFNYFKQFPPSAVEWINDESCNVVWLENITACRAMLHLSKEITKKSTDDIEVDKKNEEIDGGNNNKNISNNDNNNNNNSGEGGVIISGNQITDDINDEVKERGLKHKSRKKFDEDNFDLMSDDDEQDEEEKMDVDDEDDDNDKEDENTNTNKQNDTNSDINTTTTTTNINDNNNNINDESKKEEDNDSGKDNIASSVFNGMKYREGQPYKNVGELYMRFATRDDRKELGASNKSKYYQKYGNPNFGGLKGLISTSHKKRHLAWKREKVLKKVRREIEEIEWMTKGVPEVTKFDKHISETKLPDVRERVRKRRMIPHYGDDGGDDGDDDNQSTEVVIGNEEEEDNDSQSNVDDDDNEDNDNKSNVSDSEDDVKMSKRSKIPRMKMYADEYNDERMHHHRSHHHHQSENKPVTSRLGKRKDPYHSPHHSPNRHHHSPTHHHHSPTHHRPHSSSLLSAKSRLGIRVTTDNEHYHRHHHHHHKQQHQQSKDGVKSRLGKR